MSRRLVAPAAALLAACSVSPGASTDAAATRAGGQKPSGAVLRVGTWRGARGTHASIQAAVDAAHPGDWILVAPGDWRETGAPEDGVRITTPGIHLRGMDRNRVVVDGTLPGFPACSAAAAAQNPGAAGRNGIEVFATDGVSVENLTVCNFLGVNGANGNEVWWNGGDGSGAIGMGSYRGAYLTASSTYFDAASPAMAMYGIFVSNASGPGLIERSYASNMADSGIYVGACPDCDATLRFVHAQNSALGYSGSNSGGRLVIEDSVWDHNRAGIVPNSLANDDLPSPQDGACPDDPTASCTIIRGNLVFANDNPNVPSLGLTATAPIGTGIELSGGRNDTVTGNVVADNGAWGILVHDYPDTSPSEGSPQYCAGGVPNTPTPFGAACYFAAYGNRVERNLLFRNGGFGNPGNADLANATVQTPLQNCFLGNVRPGGGTPTSDPPSIQDPSVLGACGEPAPIDTSALLGEIACAGLGLCFGGETYPQPTGVVLMPIPDLPGMPEPCAGVPANPWCPGRH